MVIGGLSQNEIIEIINSNTYGEFFENKITGV